MIYIEWELFETNPNKDTIVDEIHYFWLTISDLKMLFMYFQTWAVCWARHC